MEARVCDGCDKRIEDKERCFEGHWYAWSRLWSDRLMSPPKKQHYCEKCMKGKENA